MMARSLVQQAWGIFNGKDYTLRDNRHSHRALRQPGGTRSSDSCLSFRKR